MDLVDNELTLTPIAGKSGKAYMGTYPDGARVFVKMNTTPILVGLAREQIAPQLLWSRRMADGNVMSAQEWLSGKILTPTEMDTAASFTSFDDTVASVGLFLGDASRFIGILVRIRTIGNWK